MEVHTYLKKAFNEQCRSNISSKKINLDMLLQGYAKLNKEISRFAYLKKKWANASNQCYEQDFKTAIQKRNNVERILKVIYCLSTDEIKEAINSMEVLLTQANCDLLVNLLNSNDYILLDVKD